MKNSSDIDVSSRDTVRLEVTASFDQLPLGRAEWDAWVIEMGAEIYRSYDWCRIWWKFYGKGRELRIFTFWQGETLVGLFPFFIESLGWGPFRVRAAKEMCSDYTLGTLEPMGREEVLQSCVRQTIDHLLGSGECDLVRYGVLVGEPRLMEALESIGREDSDLALIRLPHGTESVLHLKESFAEYLGGLSRNHRTNYKRSVNRLEREVDFEVGTLADGGEVGLLFEEFVALHTEQWRAVGESGHFGDWPDALAFHREMATTQAELGHLFLVFGKAKGETVSFQYGYGIGRKLTWLLPARRMGKEWKKFGLGRVGFVSMVEKAIEKGFRNLHLGGAYWRYKTELGGVEEKAETVVVAGGGSSERRTRRLIAAFELLHLLYYKIWFKRIAPRLPLVRGPLWHRWIRWRL